MHKPEQCDAELHIALWDEPAGDVHGDIAPVAATVVHQSEDERATTRREGIAIAMWNDYQAELAHHCASWNM